jgi:hypothetical protein
MLDYFLLFYIAFLFFNFLFYKIMGFIITFLYMYTICFYHIYPIIPSSSPLLFYFMEHSFLFYLMELFEENWCLPSNTRSPKINNPTSTFMSFCLFLALHSTDKRKHAIFDFLSSAYFI